MIGLTHNGLVTVGAFSAAVAVLGLGGLALCAWLYDPRDRRQRRDEGRARLDPATARAMKRQGEIVARSGVSAAEMQRRMTEAARLPRVRNVERSIDVEAR